MRRKAWDDEGVSQIIGALLLTLIVVGAASSFALFVNQRQEAAQDQQLLEMQRSLENLEVTKIVPTDSIVAGNTWEEFNLTISSLHTETSEIMSIFVNNNPVRTGELWRFNRTSLVYETKSYIYSKSLKLDAREQVSLVVNLTSDFFGGDIAVFLNDAVVIEIFTEWSNSFSRSFQPPTALINVQVESLWNGSDYTDHLIFDGSMSDHSGDGYIVSWDWHVNNDAELESINLTGRKVTGQFAKTGINHWINLTVTDNYGFTGNSTLIYYY